VRIERAQSHPQLYGTTYLFVNSALTGRVLGKGAFATVYLGEHQHLERPAAIKVLHVRLESAHHESFRREARTIAQLDHPHIIGVYDFGFESDTPYLVMEYTPHGTLREHFPKGMRLSFEHIVTYVRQVASALDYAQKQHVIHRDIKPENILLNTRGEAVLSDFGIAVVQSTLDSLSSVSKTFTQVGVLDGSIRVKLFQVSEHLLQCVIFPLPS
jgi:eukaryotic-like serine/threonine-protein kinase